MKKTKTKKINDSVEVKRKKTKSVITSKASKSKDEDELIETFDDDDLNFDLGSYRDVYESMRDW
jgi:hypothetical protein